jgi:hypothetical protein
LSFDWNKMLFNYLLGLLFMERYIRYFI